MVVQMRMVHPALRDRKKNETEMCANDHTHDGWINHMLDQNNIYMDHKSRETCCCVLIIMLMCLYGTVAHMLDQVVRIVKIGSVSWQVR